MSTQPIDLGPELVVESAHQPSSSSAASPDTETSSVGTAVERSPRIRPSSLKKDGASASPSSSSTPQDPHERNLLHRTTSNWGEDERVQPARKGDPGFEELRRALTGTSSRNGEFSLEKTLKNARKESPTEGNKSLDVAWKGLSVRGVGADAVFADDFGSAFNIGNKIKESRQAKANAKASSEANAGDSNLGKNEKYLIDNFSGVLKAGEMALVVGRPGAGCTTFLKAVTNNQRGYAGTDGEVRFGSMDAKEARDYPGQIVFNAEDDTHYPTLTTGETLQFALRMKTPAERPDGVSRKEFEDNFLKVLLKTFGIEHAEDTLVGNEYVRGVSGGERKRVSIAEVLVNRASVVAWDNSSRGLDASTALEYCKSVRTITDVLDCTTFVSLYQAGNQIYDLFDKVMVIAAGHCIYWGPRKDARPYFENLGFKCPPGQNVADYLTSVTVTTERIIAEGKQGSVPTSPEEFVAVYEKSDIAKQARKDLDDHLADSQALVEKTDKFKAIVSGEKAKRSGKKSPYTASLMTQVSACTKRQLHLMWNDKASIAIKQGSCIAQSIILGSLFYMLPQNTGGLFTRGGALFFILLFNALLGMSETTSSFEGRAILAKHKSFAMYRPSAVALAQVVTDFPILIGQVTLFLIPIYFMVDLRQSAAAFFTLWIITYVTTLALLAFFRMIGFSFSTFGAASQVSGLAVGLLVLYTGYLIPQTQMKPWLAWTRYLNPLYWAFESAMINEFPAGRQFACVGANLVPSGPNYSQAGGNFVCTVAGSVAGQPYVDGAAYLSAQLGYSPSHLWRNVGIIIAFWIFFVFVTAVGVERLKAAGTEKNYLTYKRTNDKSEQAAIAGGGAPSDDPEKNAVKQQPIGEQKTKNGKEGGAVSGIKQSETVFLWKNLDYTVSVPGGHRQLLNQVQGYTKPGTLTALMGASGAGKTTLLDVLALRKDDGVVKGDILVDGRPLGLSFQRTTGYVAQTDIHEPKSTVREALIFSARLRQPREVSDAEKIAYVDTVIDLLELHDIQNAIIGNNNVGLGVEQRKRLTIGVELVAKPVLLFLDEPTSGLDGQSSFNILRFLRKLADAGQSMLVTIHQPSALLFSQFDRLLLLARGGHTVYFGELGEHGSAMKEYFAKNGVDCPEDANPAEFMIDVVSGSLSKGRDWGDVWKNSEEYKQVTKDVEELEKECAGKPPSFEEDGRVYATTMGTQFKLVVGRANVAMWRDLEYLQGKLGLVVGSALLNSLSFLQLDNSVASLQNRLFSVFQGMFIAPGLFAQIQPRFIRSRMLFEAREKPSKMYHWLPFVCGEFLAETPWLIIAGTLYFLLWYFVVFPVGISTNPQHAGPMYALMVLYQFWALGFAYMVAAVCGNEQQAALINPIFLGLMASFSGVLVPYAQITAFWRYWIYYLNPWTYILGGQVFFAMHNIPVVCNENEYARFPAPSGQTCGAYLAPFIQQVGYGYVRNPAATATCEFCQYSSGDDYLSNINLGNDVDGPRNIGITVLYTVAFIGLSAVFMWIRSRPSKKAKA